MPVKVIGFHESSHKTVEIDFDAINRAMGVSLQQNQKRALAVALDDYLAAVDNFEKAPNVAELKKQLEEIEVSAHQLAVIFLDTTGKNDAAISLSRGLLGRFDIDRERLARFLYELAENSKAARKSVPPARPGRTPNVYLDRLIINVGKIYHEAGGQGVGSYKDRETGKYTGRLLDAICELLKQAERPHSRSTVAQMIEKVRRDTRKDKR